MSQNHRFAVVLACCLIVTVGMLGSVAVGLTVAQDDGIPSIPGNYYGEVSIADESVDSPIRIEAVADGEVEDTILTESDGSFGGPTISDEDLEVQEPDSGEVEFQIGGTPVEIVSLEGNTIESATMPWDSGTQEVVLEADAETVAPNLNITVTGAPETVEAGSDAIIDLTLDNAGPSEADTDIELINESGAIVATTPITVGIDETSDSSLTWTPEETAEGSETLSVQVGNSTTTTTIEIEPLETPEIAPSPGDGGGQGGGGQVAGGAGTGGDETDQTRTPDEIDGSVSEAQPIFNSASFDLSQVRFSETAHVVAITWEGGDLDGSVATTTFSDPPAEVTPVPGEIESVSNVTVPAELTDESAIVEQRVTTDRLDEVGANATELQGLRFADGEWNPVPTTVGEQTDDQVVVESEVPGFSYLAVSAVGTPQAVINTDAESLSSGDELQLDASDSTTPYGELVRYEWTVNNETLTGENVTTQVEDTGEINIELTVENDGGKATTATQTATVTTGDGIPGFTVSMALAAIILVVGSLALRDR